MLRKKWFKDEWESTTHPIEIIKNEEENYHAYKDGYLFPGFYRTAYDAYFTARTVPEHLVRLFALEYGRVSPHWFDTQIISAFPGMGKTSLAKSRPGEYRDLDSSQFEGDFLKYFQGIKLAATEGWTGILISSHDEIRQMLKNSGLFYNSAFPWPGRKAEFLENYYNRGNDDEFVERISENWLDWIDGMRITDGQCRNFCFYDNKYLIDAMGQFVKVYNSA